MLPQANERSEMSTQINICEEVGARSAAQQTISGVNALFNPRLLARNSIYNLCGSLLPLLAAAVSVPRLTLTLGVDAFGILTVAWTIVGYFTFFDLGLGRAVTKLVSEKMGCGAEEE